MSEEDDEKEMIIEEGIDLLENTEMTKKREREQVDIQNIVRPGFEATENSSYYNLAALYVLLHAHITEGVSVPALFSQDTNNYAPKYDY